MNTRLPTARKTRVAIFAPFFPPAFLGGGPIRTLAALVSELPEHIRADIMTCNIDLGAREPLDVPPDRWIRHGAHEVLYATASLRGRIRGINAALSRRPDVVYLNSFFDPLASILPFLLLKARRFRGPVLLAPRGELSPGALSLKGPKKAAFISLYRALGLHRSVVWHASTAYEERDIRRAMGPKVAVVVRENESTLPSMARRHAASAGPLRAVFLSRIVPKKGLDVALRALQHVSLPVHLDIFGALEDQAYAAACQALAESSPDHVRVEFHGGVTPEEVADALASHDVMLFPTFSENFGHVISEALSQSVPVMLPDTTPWTGRIRDFGAGEIVAPSTDAAWLSAIESWACLSQTQRSERRHRAADAFDAWRASPRQPSVFELVPLVTGRDAAGPA